MATYMYQCSYTAEAMASLVKNPHDRVAVVSRAVESLGGKVIGGWMAFGEFDIMLIMEMPDSVSAGAFAVAVAAGGAVRSGKTTVLLNPEEISATLNKAQKAGYTPPAS